MARTPSAMTAMAAVLAIAAALLAGPGATEMALQSAGILIDAAEVALDTPRFEPAARQIASATGHAGMPGGGVLGIVAAPQPVEPADAAVATGVAALQTGLVLLLLVAANLLALGPRDPDPRPLRPDRQEHQL